MCGGAHRTKCMRGPKHRQWAIRSNTRSTKKDGGCMMDGDSNSKTAAPYPRVACAPPPPLPALPLPHVTKIQACSG